MTKQRLYVVYTYQYNTDRYPKFGARRSYPGVRDTLPPTVRVLFSAVSAQNREEAISRALEIATWPKGNREEIGL